MENFNAFCAVLESHISLFEGLMSVETQKLSAIAGNDIDKLDQHMKSEQAYALELRGLDAKREMIQAKLGCAGLPLNQIIEKSEGERKKKLLALYLNLKDRIEDLDATIACTKKFIELHLNSIDLLEARMKTQRNESEKPGSKKSDDKPPRFTSVKV